MENIMTDELVEQPVGGALTAPSQAPSFMEPDSGMGVEDLGKYVVPPRLKIVQSNSNETFLSRFDKGDAIIVPQMFLIAAVNKNEQGKPADTGQPFHFVPLFFFPEWCCWNPIETRGTLPSVRYRTTDPNDPAVSKCRDPKLWKEEIDGFACRWVEHLNFISVIIGDHELAGTPVIISFARAEHRAGSNFAALIKMRKAPMFGCQFEARVTFRPDNNKGQWYGLDISNPSQDSGITPFLTDEVAYDAFKKLHLEMKEAHGAAKIKVDYEEEPPTDDGDGEY